MSDTLGTYGGAGPDGLPKIAAFEQWLNRPVRALDFFNHGSSWDNLVSSADWALHYAWSRQTRIVSFGFPMLVHDVAGDFNGVINGAYDQHFNNVGNMLVKYGQSAANLRIGWEMNGGWYPWAVGQAVGGATKNAPLYAAAFRRIVMLLRSIPGTAFHFDFNPALGWNQFPWPDAWPGTQYVDMVGLDTYNQWWTDADKDPVKRWDTLVNGMFGLKDHVNFASSVHKRISFPEWATGTRSDGHGGGDDPLFISNMTAWIRSHSNVAYHNYWNFPASDYNGRLADFPQSATRFKALWGA